MERSGRSDRRAQRQYSERDAAAVSRVVRFHPGDIVVVLSDADFISFSMHWSIGKGLVGIKSGRAYPLTLPNVARNVIAHELGHAIGLAHNSGPTMLMCGRPAPRRPIEFRSSTEHYFPLTGDEKALLLQLYSFIRSIGAPNKITPARCPDRREQQLSAQRGVLGGQEEPLSGRDAPDPILARNAATRPFRYHDLSSSEFVRRRR